MPPGLFSAPRGGRGPGGILPEESDSLMTAPSRLAFTRVRGLAAVALLAIVLAGASRADELPGFTGFTRPGTPADTVTGEKVIPAALDAETQKFALGGSVYFMVLQRDAANADDPWGIGIKGLDLGKSFQAGVDSAGVPSPVLDSEAKYLYLYQVVNDRHTATPIRSAAVKLLVEPRDITSWGYFAGVGIATVATGKQAEAASKIRPVSFSNIVAEVPVEKAYLPRAAAVLDPGLRLTRVPTRRGEAAPGGGPGQGKLVSLVWDALDPAINPDYVMLLTGSDFERGPSFRAIWGGAAGLGKDNRSTVFGFTSNLPPTLEPVKIRGLVRDVQGKEIRPAAVDNQAEGEPGREGLNAEGRVPTPRPEGQRTPFTSLPPAPALPASPPPPLPPPPPGLPIPAAGAAGTPAGGTGAGTAALAPPASVSGSGGSSSGGSGSGTGTSRARQAVSPLVSVRVSQAAPIISISNIVRQQQQQQQQQRQQQQQQQHQHQGGGPSAVVPQPAAVVLAAIGLPFLLFVRRRKK
jgi:hypothetical protein